MEKKLVEEAFGALGQFPLIQCSVAILILVVGLLFVRSALRDKPPAPPAPPPPVPVQIESPWLVQHLIEMHLEVEQIKGTLGVMSNQLSGIVTLLKRRQGRRSK